MKNKPSKDIYFVAVKVFLRNINGQLFIFKDRFGDWDLPGGRLLSSEFKTPLSKVVVRKIKEELGSAVKGELEDSGYKVLMRHERNEILSNGKKTKKRIFAIGYEALYRKGEIKLGKNHLESKWVDIKTFNPKEYFTGGWLQGVEEFIQYKNKTIAEKLDELKARKQRRVIKKF